MKKLYYRLRNFHLRSQEFNVRIAYEIRRDILHPPGKSLRYINSLSNYMDKELKEVIKKYQNLTFDLNGPISDRRDVWVCWWQGEDSMPEIVHMCYHRLKYYCQKDQLNLHLITFDNYESFVTIPKVILEKFQEKKITLTHLSDILRFLLLAKFGGYWVDSTVLFTGPIPREYFTKVFYSQKMENYENYPDRVREACGSRWCGFSVGGEKGNILFCFMNDAFESWWNKHVQILDYVMIDYMFLSAYKHIPVIKKMIDAVPDNNEDIFEMGKVLNNKYSDSLYKSLLERNVMHKCTYKNKLYKYDDNNNLTLYGYLLQDTYENYSLDNTDLQ